MKLEELIRKEKFQKLLKLLGESSKLPIAVCNTSFTKIYYKNFDGELCKMPFTAPVAAGDINFFLVVNIPFSKITTSEKDTFFLIHDLLEYFLKYALPDLSVKEKISEEINFLLKEKKYLYELGNILKANYSLEETADRILKLTAEYFEIERGSIMLLGDNNELYFIAAYNIPEEVVKFVRVKNGEGIAGYVAQTGKPLLVEDAENFKKDIDMHQIVEKKKRFKTDSFMCIPLIVRDKIIGVMNLTDKKDNKNFTSRELQLLLSVSSQISAVLHNFILIRKLETLNKELEDKVRERTRELENALNSLEKITKELHEKNKVLEEIAVTDKLTSLFNRGYFEDRLKFEIEKSFKFKRELSLLFIDLDKFKKINDTYGHLVGDKLLQKISEVIKESIRKTDIAARYGGDEFVVILPETNIESAKMVAEKIRENIENTFIVVGDKKISVTASIGVAGIKEGQSTTFEKLIKFTDKSLYEAKKKGRNRVYVMDVPNTIFSDENNEILETLKKRMKKSSKNEN